jgi:hypothetical protein
MEAGRRGRSGNRIMQPRPTAAAALSNFIQTIEVLSAFFYHGRLLYRSSFPSIVILIFLLPKFDAAH